MFAIAIILIDKFNLNINIPNCGVLVDSNIIFSQDSTNILIFSH